MKFILLINVKMPTIVGILTLMGRINSILIAEKQDKYHLELFQHFSFYEQLKFHTQLRWAWKKSNNPGASLIFDKDDYFKI